MVLALFEPLAGDRLPCGTIQALWSGHDLRRIAQNMMQRAAGPDDWNTKALCCLPSAWWDTCAQLWEVIYQNAKVSSLWQHVCVALLCIASVMWRVTWLTQRDFGAAAGRSVAHALIRITDAATHDPDTVFIA